MGASLDGEGELDEIAPHWLEPETLQELFQLADTGANPASFTDVQKRTWQGLKENAFKQLANSKKAQGSEIQSSKSSEEKHSSTPPPPPPQQAQDSERTGAASEEEQLSAAVAEMDVDTASPSMSPTIPISEVSPTHGGRGIDDSFTATECKQELLEFFEDSPMFRKKISDFDANACNLAGYLEDIIRCVAFRC